MNSFSTVKPLNSATAFKVLVRKKSETQIMFEEKYKYVFCQLSVEVQVSNYGFISQ